MDFNMNDLIMAYEQCKPFLKRELLEKYQYSPIGNLDQAIEDIISDGLLKAIEKFDTHYNETKSNPKTWLTIIIRNYATNYFLVEHKRLENNKDYLEPTTMEMQERVKGGLLVKENKDAVMCSEEIIANKVREAMR